MTTQRFRYSTHFTVNLKSQLACLLVGVCSITALPVFADQELVASGLDNPRGLAFGPEGALYVAESGFGGDGPSVPGSEGAPVSLGNSGAITRIYKGKQIRILTGLPSVAAPDGFRAIGPDDISFQGRGNMYVSFGLGGDPAKMEPLGEAGKVFGTVVRFQPSGHWSEVADIGAYEAAVNPDGQAVDSNPYSLSAGPGFLAVVDAGGNSLLGVRANGEIATLAVFESRMVPAPPFLGLPPGAQIPMQAVPDSVAKGPDGAFYVGELTGFPFVPGAARVHRVVPRGNTEVFADGFTNIVDIDFGPDGSLYVLQHDANGLLVPGDAGSLIRIRPNGTRSTLSSDLVNPTSVAIGPDGAAYVSNYGSYATIGEIVRISTE